MQESTLTMRSFGDPLSINSYRLRQTERTGEVLLRRVCEQESYSGPPTEDLSLKSDGQDFHEQINEMNGTSCMKQHMGPSCSKHDLEDSDEEEMTQMFSKSTYLVPSKSQVLFYLSSSTNFKIVRTGSDLQITDSSDFPLMDVWAERACCSSDVWIVESYGRRVLMLSPSSSSSWSLFRKQPTSTQTVYDWNGEMIGFFLPGNPFLIQNSSRQTIARCATTEPDERRESWNCVLEGSDREVARLDHGSLRFTPEIGFQLKLLILAAFSRAIAGGGRQPLCWPFWR